jgi:DNA-binding response OmpR family regulator
MKHGLRILLVEDNAQSRFLFSTALRRAGHEVVEAESGEKAVLLIGSFFTPELILLDIGLPGMSGHTVIEEMRSHPERPPTPIIAVTGGRLTRGEMERLGLDDVIHKPVLPSDLVARVDAWWDQRQRSGDPGSAGRDDR